MQICRCCPIAICILPFESLIWIQKCLCCFGLAIQSLTYSLQVEMNFKTSFIILASYVAILLFLHTFILPSYVDTPELHSLPSSTYQNNCHGLTKWAIVTSSDNTIMPSMLKFLNSTQDWCLLVIGTHTMLWSASVELNSSCLIYMSIAALQTLPYKLVSYASLKPYNLMNSFSWKNIGYLYAIESGARVI